MKKTMVITLMDGTVIHKDLSDFIKNAQSDPRISANDRLPINAPADHPVFQGLIQFTVMNGFEEHATRSNVYFSWVGPANIKTIEIMFAQS